ncbi:DUF2867 domain-containing protein [Burkholderia sp. FERM BP-3421]|jgi:hypothetical protein|uniref:DUF2867 domain-containing protein n=1 Tax=Burkholderia sp. FERM BP-3421 TaxID=1494466 RepID=UPI002362581B|nr:DUF2867 domain-containing protein [Burkholderia sp. FERM BP-3421]WDD91942.1 DUF2867 domain-containing protein [Burkholderia sp. FERM BP-3421]
MKARSVVPEIDCARILPGFDFADAYQVAAPAGIDAIAAADRMFADSPLWLRVLLVLRNRLGMLVALKPAHGARFPVLQQSPREVLMGFDDYHLDFRVAVVVADGRATITTIVRTHNLLGRGYLAAIMPFHRLIAAHVATQIGLSGA